MDLARRPINQRPLWPKAGDLTACQAGPLGLINTSLRHPSLDRKRIGDIEAGLPDVEPPAASPDGERIHQGMQLRCLYILTQTLA